MTRHKKMAYDDYIKLSAEEQLRYGLLEAEELLFDADAILDADGNWVAVTQTQAEPKQAVGFGEDPAESEFD